jgi:hypothetical protein
MTRALALDPARLMPLFLLGMMALQMGTQMMPALAQLSQEEVDALARSGFPLNEDTARAAGQWKTVAGGLALVRVGQEFFRQGVQIVVTEARIAGFISSGVFGGSVAVVVGVTAGGVGLATLLVLVPAMNDPDRTPPPPHVSIVSISEGGRGGGSVEDAAHDPAPPSLSQDVSLSGAGAGSPGSAGNTTPGSTDGIGAGTSDTGVTSGDSGGDTGGSDDGGAGSDGGGDGGGDGDG